MELSKMIEMTREVEALFEMLNTKKWSIETKITELVGEVGTLADSIMIKEGYRSLRKGQKIDLGDDIVDIIFMLALIADHYCIDLEKTYENMIETTKAKLEKKINALNIKKG
jgi:NTP pyrophosphatase (non-canonical NTP hydrolase)